MRNIIKSKSYQSYERLSRYSPFPYFYNETDDKYIYGTTRNLKENTSYKAHTVIEGDSLDTIALYYYNNPTYYWIIADFNRIQDPFKKLKVGTVLKIPTFSNIEFDI